MFRNAKPSKEYKAETELPGYPPDTASRIPHQWVYNKAAMQEAHIAIYYTQIYRQTQVYMDPACAKRKAFHNAMCSV